MTKNLKNNTVLGTKRKSTFDNNKNEDAKKYKLLRLTKSVTIKLLEVIPNQSSLIYVKPQIIVY